MENDIKITEGVIGYFVYHVSKKESKTRAICGDAVMDTELPLSAWGFRGHLNEKYCKVCGDYLMSIRNVSVTKEKGIEKDQCQSG